MLANAETLAATLQEEGLRIVCGGTDNHLMLVDLGVLGKDPQGNEITGKLVEKALDQVGNPLQQEHDPLRPQAAAATSGIRLGTPAGTTRGLGADDFAQVARWIAAIAKDPTNADLLEKTRLAVAEMMLRFPVPA